jgi:serine/threonine-protein kinase
MQICPTCLERYEGEIERCPDDQDALLRGVPDGDGRCGTVVAGRFLLLEQLAEGAMGSVYRAWQQSMQREVALKLVPAKLVAREAVRRRLLREARATGLLRSPHVVSSYDSGFTQSGEFFIAMELVRGRSLARLLRDEGPLPLPRALSILRQLCRALEAVHAAGFVHRDLKPGNVLVERRDGHDLVRLVDFGLVRTLGEDQSRITLSGETIGSPAYLSPEQAAGQPAGPAADLYALGVIAFELVSGRLPFHAHNVFQLMAMHIYAAPPPLVAATGFAPAFWALSGIVKRCLQKDPQQRPGSALELREALAAIDPRGCEAPAVPPDAPPPEWERIAQDLPTFHGRGGPGERGRRPGRLRRALARARLRLRSVAAALDGLGTLLAGALRRLGPLLVALPVALRRLGERWTEWRIAVKIRALTTATRSHDVPDPAPLAICASCGEARRPDAFRRPEASLSPSERAALALAPTGRRPTVPAVRRGGTGAAAAAAAGVDVGGCGCAGAGAGAGARHLLAPAPAAGPAHRAARLALPHADAPTWDERWDVHGNGGADGRNLRRATDARAAGGR